MVKLPLDLPVSLAFSQAGRSYKTALTDQSAAETAKHFRRSWRVGLICDSNVPNCHQNKISYIFSLSDTWQSTQHFSSSGLVRYSKQRKAPAKGPTISFDNIQGGKSNCSDKNYHSKYGIFLWTISWFQTGLFFSFLPTTRRAANKFGEVYGVLIWYWIGERKKLVLSWCFHDFSMNFHNFMIFPWFFKPPPKEMSIPTWPSPKERFDTVVRKTTHQLDMFMSRSKRLPHHLGKSA